MPRSYGDLQPRSSFLPLSRLQTQRQGGWGFKEGVLRLPCIEAELFRHVGRMDTRSRGT